MAGDGVGDVVHVLALGGDRLEQVESVVDELAGLADRVGFFGSGTIGSDAALIAFASARTRRMNRRHGKAPGSQ